MNGQRNFGKERELLSIIWLHQSQADHSRWWNLSLHNGPIPPWIHPSHGPSSLLETSSGLFLLSPFAPSPVLKENLFLLTQEAIGKLSKQNQGRCFSFLAACVTNLWNQRLSFLSLILQKAEGKWFHSNEEKESEFVLFALKDYLGSEGLVGKGNLSAELFSAPGCLLSPNTAKVTDISPTGDAGSQRAREKMFNLTS